MKINISPVRIAGEIQKEITDSVSINVSGSFSIGDMDWQDLIIEALAVGIASSIHNAPYDSPLRGIDKGEAIKKLCEKLTAFDPEAPFGK